jgi:serine/threonine-protein kinase
MSTELMSQFLEGLYASGLLDNNRIDALLRRPEPPQGDVEGLARFLESDGCLTRFQINEIRQGRGKSLTFAGYRLLDRIADGPSGPSYRAFHPALQQSVVLRWLNVDWLQPADDLRSYVERAQAACLINHPNAVNTLDAGLAGEMPFIVQEYVDGADLGILVNEMGAIPVPLACEYIRQAALVLRAFHDRGLYHGDFSPLRMILTPIIRKLGVNGNGQAVSLRPAPNAAIKVAETGLMPRRPAASQVSLMQSHLLGEVHFMAPERLTAPGQDVKGDLYSLGASLYFLLAARPPFVADSTVDALLQLQQAEPAPIGQLRNDIDPPLAEFIHKLLAKDPNMRPQTAGEAAQFLQTYCNFSSNPAPVEPQFAVPIASETISIPNALPALMAEIDQRSLPEALPESQANHLQSKPLVEALPENTSDSQVYSPRDSSPATHGDYQDQHDPFADDGRAPSKPRPKKEKAKSNWPLLILGIALHLVAALALILWLTGAFDSDSTPTKEEPVKQKEPTKPKRR